MDAVLHAEISHRWTRLVRLHLHVGTELGIEILDALHQRLVLQDFLLAGVSQTFQEHHRIVAHVMIDFDIEFAEQVTSFRVPHPPHVVGNLVQTLQFFWQCSLHSQHLPLWGICIICFNLHNAIIVFVFN